MRVVELTERRPQLVRVPRADAVELRRRYGFAFDVVPGWVRGTIRVTPRGVVGTVMTAGVRWVVRPKLPAEALYRLIDPDYTPGGTTAGQAWVDNLGDLLAGRLSKLLADRTVGGVRADYIERRRNDAAVRGRIDFPRLARSSHPFAPVPVVTDEFTADVPWNQIPKAAAMHLLSHGGLTATVRARLAVAMEPFASVSGRVPPPAEWDALIALPRTTPYRDILAWSQVILTSLAVCTGSNYLCNMERLFENYITTNLGLITQPKRYAVVSGRMIVVPGIYGSSVVLRPDLVALDGDGVPRAVFDAKWKVLSSSGPNPADVHQALAYALTFGVRTTGLIYPGRRFARTAYQLPRGAGRFWVVQLRLTGDPSRIAAGLRWLGRRCVNDR